MGSGARKDMDRLVKSLGQQGWTVTYTKGGHWRCQPPDGPPVCVPSTPSSSRTIMNTRARLRRAGAEV